MVGWRVLETGRDMPGQRVGHLADPVEVRALNGDPALGKASVCRQV